MAYEIISQNNTVTTLADENGNVITVPSRSILDAGTTFTLVKINNNTATLEDSNGKIYRDIPCCIDLTQVTGFSVTKVNNNKATLEDGDGNVFAGVPCVVNLTGTGGGSAVIEELNVTPSTSAQTITASGGTDGYSPVNVAAVDATIDANITANNIKDGVTILGITGNVVELNGETKTVTPQVYGQTLYPTSPKNAITEITVNAVTSSIDANIQAGNIKDGVQILGVTGNYTGGASSKFGVSIDNVFGVVSNGVLNPPSQKIDIIDLTGVREIADRACINRFYFWGKSNDGPMDNTLGYLFSAPDLETIGTAGCSGMLCGCNRLYSIDMQNLTTIGDNGCVEMFSLGGTTYTYGLLTDVNLSSVETVGANGCEKMFSGHQELRYVNVSGITSIGDSGFIGAFYHCGIESISFNSLETIASNAFGTGNTNYAFRYCGGLLEIHFPIAMQATIQAMSGYSAKWGASSATVYFDIVTTLTGGDGYTYKRKQKLSTSDENIAWENQSDGLIYYTGGPAEPVVSDTIYSNPECTIPVTTVDSIA